MKWTFFFFESSDGFSWEEQRGSRHVNKVSLIQWRCILEINIAHFSAPH